MMKLKFIFIVACLLSIPAFAYAAGTQSSSIVCIAMIPECNVDGTAVGYERDKEDVCGFNAYCRQEMAAKVVTSSKVEKRLRARIKFLEKKLKRYQRR